MSISNIDPLIARSICLGFATAVARFIEFSNLTSVILCTPCLRRSSSLIINISDTSILLLVTEFFLADPKSLVISSQSSSGLGASSLLNSFARRDLIFPLNELPGIIGRLVLTSLTIGESTAPIAANADEPPICIPVTSSIFPLICILPYIFLFLLSLFRRKTYEMPPVTPYIC